MLQTKMSPEIGAKAARKCCTDSNVTSRWPPGRC
jgi:hypothetical protein